MHSRAVLRRIHGELPKLGIDIGQASVAKYMVGRRQPPSQTWRSFLKNHMRQVMAADFFVVPTATCRLLFALIILAHDRRRVVHVAVTAHPTASWTAQQLREAFPWDTAPRFLLRDRDHAFDGWTATAKAMGIREVLTAPRSHGRSGASPVRLHAVVLSVSIRGGCATLESSRRGFVKLPFRWGFTRPVCRRHDRHAIQVLWTSPRHFCRPPRITDFSKEASCVFCRDLRRSKPGSTFSCWSSPPSV